MEDACAVYTRETKWQLVPRNTRNIPRACFTLSRATHQHAFHLYSSRKPFIRPREMQV